MESFTLKSFFKSYPNASRVPAVYRQLATIDRENKDWKEYVEKYGDPEGLIAKLIKAKFDCAELNDRIADLLEAEPALQTSGKK